MSPPEFWLRLIFGTVCGKLVIVVFLGYQLCTVNRQVAIIQEYGFGPHWIQLIIVIGMSVALHSFAISKEQWEKWWKSGEYPK